MSLARLVPGPLRRAAKDALSRLGYGLHPVQPGQGRYDRASYDTSRPLPAGAAEILRNDHPRLLELRARYGRASSPMRAHSVWDAGYLSRELALPYFRGDNAYVWQFRNTLGDERRKYFLFAQYLAARDPARLLTRLSEDGLFGCWTFQFASMPTLSRDLLDSVNEIYFLDRHCGVLSRDAFTLLDIGAGYGRLAHRMTAATRVRSYFCVDAVAESTFLSEYYLAFRGCNDRAHVVPLDEVAATLKPGTIDLAVNIHSFSEMPFRAIEGWLRLVGDLRIPQLLIVPNPAEGLLSYEPDRSRRDFMPLLHDLGYELQVQEPTIADPDVRDLVGIRDNFFLLTRR